MYLEALLPRQSAACITCEEPPACHCNAQQVCVRINRDCNNCSQNVCVSNADDTSAGSSGGASKGALAGGVVGAIVFLSAAVLLFYWYRRRLRLRKNALTRDAKADVPAPAETVLNRPDPTEKSSSPSTELKTVRVHSMSSNSSPSGIDAPPFPHYNTVRSNPFDDINSIQTAGTGATNVIPIALASQDLSNASSLSHSHSQSTSSSYPVRPARSPDLNLNLDHVNVSHDSLRPNYPQSTISGISAFSRNSYMSNASFSSDFLNEAPMIVTSSKSTVRQVLGVVKAEVIKTPGSLSPPNTASSEGLKSPSFVSRPTVGSPLASSSFRPVDIIKEYDESGQGNPFSDNSSSTHVVVASPTPSVATFGQNSTQSGYETQSDLQWTRDQIDSRPSSMFTQAGSVIDIGSATRVNVGLRGLNSPVSPDSRARAAFRTTMGRLVTPPTSASQSLEEQQQLALAHAQAQALAQGGERRRISASSVSSATSTRADSILESFPFVPPSPISDRPPRSPMSPLGQQNFSAAPLSPLGQHTFTVAPPTPRVQQNFRQSSSNASVAPSDDSLPAPPNRRTLGMSTGSQLSTASSGLSGFPFHIDPGATSDRGSTAPSSFHNSVQGIGGRQRASLDTLALTSDLSSFPLGFDSDSGQPSRN